MKIYLLLEGLLLWQGYHGEDAISVCSPVLFPSGVFWLCLLGCPWSLYTPYASTWIYQLLVFFSLFSPNLTLLIVVNTTPCSYTFCVSLGICFLFVSTTPIFLKWVHVVLNSCPISISIKAQVLNAIFPSLKQSHQFYFRELRPCVRRRDVQILLLSAVLFDSWCVSGCHYYLWKSC